MLLIGVLLSGGLLSLLMLNTVLAQDAFVAHDLEERSALLSHQEQALARRIAIENSPQRLAERAKALGMVPSENPVFISTADGSVLGVPTAATAPPAPAPTPATSDDAREASKPESAAGPAQ